MIRKNQRQSLGQVRIIAGQWRGRKLPVPDRPGLRPTTDRIKETLFNWLAPVIVDARCLDCFAGSGALGFEALSRYAQEVLFLENDRSVVQLLLDNLNRLKTQQGHVQQTDSLLWLKNPGTPFEVVFLDPPFRKGMLDDVVKLLEQNGWLAEEAWIYVESEVENHATVIPDNWHLYREKVAGQVAYQLYHRQTVVLRAEEGVNHVD